MDIEDQSSRTIRENIKSEQEQKGNIFKLIKVIFLTGINDITPGNVIKYPVRLHKQRNLFKV